jgi:hypothetical protein
MPNTPIDPLLDEALKSEKPFVLDRELFALLNRLLNDRGYMIEIVSGVHAVHSVNVRPSRHDRA